jgi:PAS domain S-box-containing protein
MNHQNERRFSGFTLLLVDDNPNNLFALGALIRQHTAVTVVEATSGRQAVELATLQPPDLIVLDVQMPDLDGFETATILKSQRKTRTIPIIFLTAAYKSESFQQNGIEIGAVDYLLKPIDDTLLLNKIGAYFRLIERERQLNQLLEEQVAERTRELALARNYLERIIDTMGEALLILTPEGIITRVNPAASVMTEYPPEELLGKAIGDIFEEAEAEQAGAFMGTWLEALIRIGVLKDIEARFVTRSGRRIPILFSRTAITQADQSVSDIICIAKNMSGYIKEQEDE